MFWQEDLEVSVPVCRQPLSPTPDLNAVGFPSSAQMRGVSHDDSVAEEKTQTLI